MLQGRGPVHAHRSITETAKPRSGPMSLSTGPDRWITVQTMRYYLAIQKDLGVLTWKVVQDI